MDREQYQAKMAQIKKLVLIGFIASVIVALVAIVMLGLYNINGILTIHTGNEGSKYHDPFTYPGWQSLFGFAGPMIIQGYEENTVDVFMIIAIILPILAGLACTIMLAINFKRKGTNVKKAVLEFIMCALLVLAAIAVLNIKNVWKYGFYKIESRISIMYSR